MSTLTERATVTPDDLLEMSDSKQYELVDGNLVEKEVSYLSSLIGSEVAFRLKLFLQQHPLGTVTGSDASFQCFDDDPLKVRRPDVAFIARGRLPAEELARGHVTIAPDLAVEVVSPNDYVYELNKKVQEYLRAGVRLVWVIDPENRTLLVYRADRTLAEFQPEDELTGEEVIPGFRCLVQDFFKPLDLLAKPPAA
jgi:Uma2 family endonuclease